MRSPTFGILRWMAHHSEIHMDIQISDWIYLPVAPCCLWPPANLCSELEDNRKPIVYHKNPRLLSMKMTALALRGVFPSVIHLSSRPSPKLGIRGASHWFSWDEKASCPCFPCAISDKNGGTNYKKSTNKWVKKKGPTSITRSKTRIQSIWLVCM